ncbi:cryptochrome/photolyase family protein [Vibrio sp. JPW-9-11-11]|uniref:cryptochrome/photolyase family protein n=1 Tax=Vibrio sp. JPW-9-11-11 TaxID=1416532 RepID=UPI001593A643|nr:cryptochrome/photolyase family protein [Vibrio sp. JPW-9-11-11]NVD08534.1 cryptochrome/photolyase family protein [Vibrio sp. JPW-9-11-11]
MQFQSIRLILGDQLDSNHSWFQQVDDSVLYLIAELPQEASYTRHHVQKVCAFFAAMEQFARQLCEQGHQVVHLTLDETCEFSHLPSLLEHYIARTGASRLEYQRPDEYRLCQQLSQLFIPDCEVVLVESEHFLLPFAELHDYFSPGKHVMMEHFYRKMRRRFNLLMEQGKPVGGKWNYDANNRNKLKAADIENLPEPLLFATDVSSIVERIARHRIATIGRAENNLIWPVNRNQSLSLLAHFCQVCLPLFGRFQDAMTEQHRAKWSLYHSRLSFSINSKMLHPREVVEAVLSAYANNPTVDIAQVEGFVRQIIGWREYIRAVYWVNMPNYASLNHLTAKRALPDYFWSGETKMACLHQAIGQSLEYAYAHHIQRLMVTGNFCLISEIDPDQVDSWYLGIYIDAIEWVEMPNTRGMALFADGGIVGTKPYAASGAYINRMSDYCKKCHYQVKTKSGEGACPINSLYWRFMIKHRDRLAANPRIGMIYRTWDKMDSQAQQAVLDTAQHYLDHIEQL